MREDDEEKCFFVYSLTYCYCCFLSTYCNRLINVHGVDAVSRLLLLCRVTSVTMNLDHELLTYALEL
jgi:hypothetical protein